MTYQKLGTSVSATLTRSILLCLLASSIAYGQPATQGAAQTTDPKVAALADAVRARDLELVRTLVEQGANVNGLDTRPEVAGRNGRRPLNWAALGNDTAMIELLLKLGADINGKNVSGFTPLHHAVEAQAVEAITLLLRKGADPTIKNGRNLTPAEFAVETGRSRAAAALGVGPKAE